MPKVSTKKRTPSNVATLQRECRSLVNGLGDRRGLQAAKRFLHEIRHRPWAKAIDEMERAGELTQDFAKFLRSRPSASERHHQAEASIAAGGGVNWRKVRDDV